LEDILTYNIDIVIFKTPSLSSLKQHRHLKI